MGTTDQYGDAQSFVVTYQITPPGGAWTSADNGTYTVTLGGTPVTDLAGNPVPPGPVGTFTVSLNPSATVVVQRVFDAAELDVRPGGELHGDRQPAAGQRRRGRSSSWLMARISGCRSCSRVAARPARARRSWAPAATRWWRIIRAIPTTRRTAAATPRLSTRRRSSIVPDNLSRPVGQPNPALTYTFSGFVNGENAGSAKITGAADLTTTAHDE